MEFSKAHFRLGLLATRSGIGLVIAAVVGLILAALSPEGEMGQSFVRHFVPVAMIALIVAWQKAGLLIGIVVGVVFAFAAVLIFEEEMASYYWLGQFFLSALKMIIVPLVFFAMITGITSLGDVRKLGRLGGRTVLYYFVTTAVAVVIGAVVVNLWEPGVGFVSGTLEVSAKVAAKAELGLSDIVLGFVSNNIIESFAKMQMLPIIVFALVFGAVLTTLGERGKPVIAVCDGANEAMMKVVTLIMVLAPVGIFGLVAGKFGIEMATAESPDVFWAELAKLGGYAGAVVTGLSIHAFIVIPLILRLTTGRNPLAYARGMLGALVTAFSTSSSAATLPITLEQVEENNGVDKRASQFVVPLGATVNMDGTALYEAVAVIFIAQVLGFDLTILQQLVIVITATLAAIGAAGIPQAGLVTMIIVLQAVNLPLEGIELILAIDWLLDRCRTTVNVWGDAVGAAVMEKLALGVTYDPDAPAQPPPGPSSGQGPDEALAL